MMHGYSACARAPLGLPRIDRKAALTAKQRKQIDAATAAQGLPSKSPIEAVYAGMEAKK